ncbi:MAG TPA: hypothetical protein VHR66_21990 [Gemmataceae bacterium]|jgi:hypothetical protein|nr:hypothetical protein [Gemmataceae bacterium]
MLVLLTLAAVGLYLVGWVWLMIAGFVESFPWGVGTFFFSPIGLVFSLFHWPEYKVPTFMYIGGVALYILRIAIG